MDNVLSFMVNIFTTFCMRSKEVNFRTKFTWKLCVQSVNTIAFNFNSDLFSLGRLGAERLRGEMCSE